MTINPLTSAVNALVSSTNNNTANRIRDAVNDISTTRSTRASADVSDVAVATSLQANVSGLRSALSNVAQVGSLAQTAASGAQDIQQIFNRLQDLATQSASGSLSDENRQSLDSEFQALVSEINRIADTTSFNDVNVLDGSISGSNALNLNTAIAGENQTDETSLAIESLRADDVLSDGINIGSPEAAQQAIEELQQALNTTVGTAIASVSAFIQSADFAAATLETAIANQAAAASTFEPDILESSTDLVNALAQQEAEVAAQVINNRLVANVSDDLFNS